MRKTLIPLILAGSLALMGSQCGKSETSYGPEKAPNAPKPVEMVDYFGEFSTYSNSGVALTSGDFDGDGDLDLIVASYKYGSSNNGLLYFLENDGKGNFTKRMYPKPEEK